MIYSLKYIPSYSCYVRSLIANLHDLAGLEAKLSLHQFSIVINIVEPLPAQEIYHGAEKIVVWWCKI